MAFRVKILLDSIATTRLTTFEIEFPRIILAEVNTHRMLSKNSASSRAIPVKALIQKVIDDPYVPDWGRNQPGMQSSEKLSPSDIAEANTLYEASRQFAIRTATRLSSLNVHKQDANRILEPYAWVKQVTSGTEWANFFALRTHEDAHPAFRFLARAMYIAYHRSVPVQRTWHIPYVEDIVDASLELQVMVSAARCARTSYQLGDAGFSDPIADQALYNRLRNANHMSPFEHQAEAGEGKANFNGWIQHRELMPMQNVTDFAADTSNWLIPESVFV